MKKSILFFAILFLINLFQASGQTQSQDKNKSSSSQSVYDVGEPYGENLFGTIVTDRNLPDNKMPIKFVTCRKMEERPRIYSNPNEAKDISSIRNKSYNLLTPLEKEQLITYAWVKKDSNIFKIVLQIAIIDTLSSQLDTRISAIKCLSLYNNDYAKKNLQSFLKDKEVAMISALSLVQLGMYEHGLSYIEKNYTEYFKNYNDKYITKDNVSSALMLVNNTIAIKLLMKVAEDKDPSYSIDALAALSLLGYCDYAYKGFCKYIKSSIWQTRESAFWCLAYYIGTPEAFKIILDAQTINNQSIIMIQNDPEIYVKQAIDKIIQTYNLKR